MLIELINFNQNDGEIFARQSLFNLKMIKNRLLTLIIKILIDLFFKACAFVQTQLVYYTI